MPKTPIKRVQGSVRKKLEAELEYYLAALNIDTQFALRKAVFLVRTLSLPHILTVKEALDEIQKRLALSREQWNFGRPWTYMQLRRAYWTKVKGFIRAQPYPMTPEEYAGYKKRRAPEKLDRKAAEIREQHAKRRARRRVEKGKTLIERMHRMLKKLEAEAGQPVD